MIHAGYIDKSLVMDILCDAFDTNKSVNYVVKQDKYRRERVRSLMDYSFEICYLFGEILLTDDRKGCALILYPDKKRISIKTILLDLKLAVNCVGISRALKVLNRDSKIKSFYPQHPVCYLWFIGVAGNARHKGIGSTLLDHIINSSLSMQRPVYLETSMPENIDFYRKAGFEVYHELDFGHRLFLMKRQVNGA